MKDKDPARTVGSGGNYSSQGGARVEMDVEQQQGAVMSKGLATGEGFHGPSSLPVGTLVDMEIENQTTTDMQPFRD